MKRSFGAFASISARDKVLCGVHTNHEELRGLLEARCVAEERCDGSEPPSSKRHFRSRRKRCRVRLIWLTMIQGKKNHDGS